MKILVLNGSPKIGNKSATLTLCSYLLKGINVNQNIIQKLLMLLKKILLIVQVVYLVGLEKMENALFKMI